MNIKHALVLAAAAGLCSSAMAQNDLRIAEVFGAGGNSGAPLNIDFVVLFNANATTARSLNGASLQYQSATGTTIAGTLPLPNVMIPPGQYYCVAVNFAPGANGSPVAYDYIAPSTAQQLSLAAGSGKVILASTTAATTGPTDPTVLDYVGYGTANAFEGAGAAPTLSATLAAFRGDMGCIDTNNNAADFTAAAPVVMNLSTPAHFCMGSFTDCNGNGIPDANEIAANPSLDCNNNGVIDSCELTTTTDCNGNGILDACEIAANPGLDCNHNGVLDSCDLVNTPFLDANQNGIIDTCETPGPGQDCNNNGVLDSWDLLVGALTDVNANGTPDACEGAAVFETAVNGTIQAAGARSGANGNAFLNVEGDINGTFASYGGLRFDLAPIAAQFDAAYGTANWHVTQAYLFLQQSNAAFTVSGNVRIYWSNNDALDFTPGNTTTQYANFATDLADREVVSDYAFTQGTGITIGTAQGNGTTESHLLFDENGTNSTGGTNAANEINSGGGQLTLALSPDQDFFVAATYAGRTNNTWTGPSLVVFAASNGGGTPCDPDVNQDGVSDQGDVDYLINVIAGGENPTGINPDFNQDGVADQGDIDALVNVIAGGPCP
ncbi:MAG: hypothetical protein GC200_10395 [Tepidisphaera sp.]|nr:hypothetical protein [Tepidisphaera sp.]